MAIAKIAHFPCAKVQFKNNQFLDKNAGFIKREMNFATDEELAMIRVVKPVAKEEKIINTFDI